MNTETCKSFIIKVVFVGLIAALTYGLFKYAVPLMLPFIIAFALAMVIRPLARLFNKKLHINNKVTGGVFVTVVYLVVATLVLLLFYSAYNCLPTLVDQFKNDVIPYISGIFDSIIQSLRELTPDAIPFIDELRDSLLSLLSKELSSFSVSSIGSIVSSLPGILLQVLAMIIATYFITIDNDTLNRGIESRMSAERYEKLKQFKSQFGKTIGKFVKAYFIIFLITFAELCLSFFICGINNFWLIALLVALFDLLPIVGSGTIMIPWSIISFLTGNIGLGVGLVVCWLAITVVRQFIEPRIVGRRVGVHPLLTLMAMFVGLKLFGGIGLIGLPLMLALIVGLEQGGVITIFKKRDLPPLEEKHKKRAFFKKKKEI
ncbi:MAG: sporulation integral membrane protein YtvI [Eubacteriales bacterium]|nr:sporulation integral membrane protein YtvI [Eubacteriales bacterium]